MDLSDGVACARRARVRLAETVLPHPGWCFARLHPSRTTSFAIILEGRAQRGGASPSRQAAFVPRVRLAGGTFFNIMGGCLARRRCSMGGRGATRAFADGVAAVPPRFRNLEVFQDSDFLTSGGFRWGFPESDLALFHPTSCIMGEPTRHQYRRGYDASPTRMAAPFALRLA